MSTMLMIGRTGVQAHQSHVSVVANNIANSNTYGYKRSDVSFKDLVHTERNLPVMNGVQNTFDQGYGVKVGNISEITSQGSLLGTMNPDHMAVVGKGYFAVTDQTTGEIYLTRDGTFGRDTQGNLVDSKGNRVVTKNVANIDGTVTVEPLLHMANQTANMEKIGDNYYRVAPQNLVTELQSPDLFGTIENGMVESSNVDMANEMTEMIIAQRAYSLSMKAIQTADETMDTINNLR